MSEKEILQFTLDRMVNVYGESTNTDFIIKFREYIEGLPDSPPPTTQGKKLYLVKVMKAGWVLAYNEDEAKGFAPDILMTESNTCIDVQEGSSTLIGRSKVDFGWELDCCVYHCKDKEIDITLREAIKSGGLT